MLVPLERLRRQQDALQLRRTTPHLLSLPIPRTHSSPANIFGLLPPIPRMQGRALLFADIPSDSIRRVPQDVLCTDVDHGSSFVILLKHARIVIVRSLQGRPARRVDALL